MSVVDAIADSRCERQRLLDEAPLDDAAFGELILTLNERYAVDFRTWSLNDVVIFACHLYPLEELEITVHRRSRSLFLQNLYYVWQPDTVKEWIQCLRRICTLGSFRLFAQALRYNHCQESSGEIANDLLVELPNETTSIYPSNYPRPERCSRGTFPSCGTAFGEDLMEYTVSSFVRRPHDPAYVRLHAADLLELSGGLGPAAVGVTCRRLLMFLARSPKCRCDFFEVKHPKAYKPMPECTCERVFEMDNHKEYARALFYSLLRLRPDWTSQDRHSFFIEACRQRFSEAAFQELSYSLALVSKGQPPLRHPELRPYTQQELEVNYHKTDTGVHFIGCVEVGVGLPRASVRRAHVEGGNA